LRIKLFPLETSEIGAHGVLAAISGTRLAIRGHGSQPVAASVRAPSAPPAPPFRTPCAMPGHHTPSSTTTADQMGVLRILVVGSEPGAARYLADHLGSERFEVVYARPGSDFVSAATCAPVAFAVIDGIDRRPHAAQTEIAVLKQLHPDVQIVAISTCSTEADAGIIELGLLYYLAGQSHEKLLRVIRSAAEVHSANRRLPSSPARERHF
jgi:ActR/RegA family two-component response regulator